MMSELGPVMLGSIAMASLVASLFFLRFWRDTLGLHVHKQQTIDEQGVTAALMSVGDSEIELIQPTVSDNGVARYLESRGEGLHHVCFQVDSVEADLTALQRRGVDTVIVTGLMTNFCCVTTARHAHDLDYRTLFVADASSGPDMPDLGFGAIVHSDILANVATSLAAGVAEVVTAEEAIKRFGA